MPLDVGWPQVLKNVVIIEIRAKIDTVMVPLKYSIEIFPPHFDHSYEDLPLS
jgi:hypothetical protein